MGKVFTNKKVYSLSSLIRTRLIVFRVLLDETYPLSLSFIYKLFFFVNRFNELLFFFNSRQRGREVFSSLGILLDIYTSNSKSSLFINPLLPFMLSIGAINSFTIIFFSFSVRSS